MDRGFYVAFKTFFCGKLTSLSTLFNLLKKQWIVGVLCSIKTCFCRKLTSLSTFFNLRAKLRLLKFVGSLGPAHVSLWSECDGGHESLPEIVEVRYEMLWSIEIRSVCFRARACSGLGWLCLKKRKDTESLGSIWRKSRSDAGFSTCNQVLMERVLLQSGFLLCGSAEGFLDWLTDFQTSY